MKTTLCLSTYCHGGNNEHIHSYTTRFSVLKAFALVVGVMMGLSSLLKGAEQTITLTYSSFSLTTSYAEKTASVDGYDFIVNQGYKGSNDVIQMNSSKGEGVLYNTTAIPGLKSVTVNVYSGNKTYTIYQGNSQKPLSTSAGTGTTTSTINITVGNQYFTLKVSGASYFSSVVITYETAPSIPYTVTFNNGTGLGVSSLTEASAGAGVNLPSPTPPAGCDPEYTFYGWATSSVSATTTAPYIVGTTGNIYHPSENNIELYAVYKQGSESYQLVENLSTVTAGTYYLLTTDYHAFNGTISNGHGQVASEQFSFSGGYASSVPSGAIELTLSASGSGFKMYNSEYGYLYASAASSGHLAWQNTESSYWLYNSSNWKYNSNNAYLRSYSNNSFRTYGTNNGDVLKMAKKVGFATYNTSPSCTPPTCLPPTSLASSSIGQNTATISWTAGDSETNWDYYYSTSSTTPTPSATPSGSVSTNPTAGLTSLIANTTYYWWVRANCGGGDNSVWVSGGSFTTQNYTLTAQSSDVALGTVSVSGFVITASLGECSQYASPAYTVSGTATVSQSGDVFTITPLSNCTVTINFESKPKYHVTWYVNNENIRSDEYCTGSTITSVPSDPTSGDCNGKTFVGWTKYSSYSNENDAPDDLFTEPIGTITADKTYYAVFAEETGGAAEIYSFAGGTKENLVESGASGYGLGSNYAESNAPYLVKFDTEGDYITIPCSSTPSSLTFGVKKLGGAESSTIKIQASTDGGSSYSDVQSFVTSGSQNAILSFTTTNDFPSGTSVVKILFFNKGSNVGIGPIRIYGIPYSAYTTSCTPPTTATLTYSANGGSGSMESQTVDIGGDVVILENGFTPPTGHHFVKWNASADGLGTSYNPGDTYSSLMSNVRLYAIWEKDSYSVEWYVNGEEVQNATYEYNATIQEDVVPENPAITECDDSKEFIGWTTSEIATSQDERPTILYSHDALSEFQVTEPTTFYAVFASISAGVDNNYELYSGALTEGKYIIYYDGRAMNTTVTSNRLMYASITPTNDIITTTNAAIIWHIAPSGEYWTIFNDAANKYAASTGESNKAQMFADGTDNKAKWLVVGSSTYDFINRYNTIANVNSNLRNNGTYGFACYAGGTGGPLSLYKYYTHTGYVTTCTPPECRMPVSLSVDNITTTSATLSWTARSAESQWDYYYSTSSIAPTTPTGTANENPFEITGLSENTVYYWWVRAKCSGSDRSEWAYGGSFITISSANATTLEPGDLAIVAINNKLYSETGNSADEYSFMIFKDISAGTAIDMTDNGYEKKYQGYWGTGEGFWRITRKNSSIRAGSVITISETRGRIGMGVDPVLHGGSPNIYIYVNGSQDNDNWDIVTFGPLDLNEQDQIWIMQGGSWVVCNDNKAEYTGNILYGYTATGWKDRYGYNTTHGSTIYPGCECFVSTLNIASGIAKYMGPFTEVTKREWIMRINEEDNWEACTTTNYASYGPNYKDRAGGPQAGASYELPIAPGDFSQGKWSGKKEGGNWFDCANWMSLVVPDETVDVEIPSIEVGCSEVQIYTGDTAKCKTLTISSSGVFGNTQNNSTLKVVDDITINAGGIFRPLEGNDFEIILGGDITNSGTFITNQNTSLTLTSSSSQSISAPSSGGNLKLRNLTLAAEENIFDAETIDLYGNLRDNSASNQGFYLPQALTFKGDNSQASTKTAITNITMDKTSNNLTLSGMLTVNGNAEFVKGNIIGNVTFAATATSSGATINSYVDGTVTKKANASAFIFPTGSNGVLGALEVAGLAANTDLRFNHDPDGFSSSEMPVWWNQNNMCGPNEGNAKFDHVSNMYFWNLGSSSPMEDAVFTVTADDDIHFNVATVEHEEPDIAMAIYDGCWKNLGGTASTNATSYTYISISDVDLPATRAGGDKVVTFGSIDHNTLLPIELAAFSAECNGNYAKISWTTATERNNDYFVLERSGDAINFGEVARMAGAGNSINPVDYTYNDYSVRGGDSYYRLVQVDYDGTRTVSEMIAVNCTIDAEGAPEVVAYPNPFGCDLTLRFENFGNMLASVEVYDMLGRLVMTTEVQCTQNEHEVVLHLESLSDATYNVRVSTAEFVINRKVVKE